MPDLFKYESHYQRRNTKEQMIMNCLKHKILKLIFENYMIPISMKISPSKEIVLLKKSTLIICIFNYCFKFSKQIVNTDFDKYI